MRFYRALLRLYPKSFRQEHGDEMAAVFGRELRDAGGLPGRAAAVAGAILDTLSNAGLVHLDILRQDLRYAWRALGRSRGFTATAVAVAALGIGATTAAFSVADFVLVRPLPFAEPERLAKLWERNRYGQNDVSPGNFRDWSAARSWEAMGAYTFRSVNLVSGGGPQRVDTAAVTGGVLSLLGIAPYSGRAFAAADDAAGAPGTAVLSHGLWQELGGGDVGGRQLLLDGAPYTVIGVMPRGFHFPTRAVRLWTTLRLSQEQYRERDNNYLQVIARARPGVSLEAARAEMAVVSAQLQRRYPEENDGVSAMVLALRDELTRQSRVLLVALSAAALCLLAIACANLASLLLARGLARRRELAVRSALGAGRERLVRQLVTESLLLAGLGGAVGIAVALGAVPLLTRLVPDSLPIARMPAVDLRVLGLAAVLTALTGVAFGVLPALRASSRPDTEALRGGARTAGGRSDRLRSALVAGEVGASVVLLVSAGLLLRALWRLQSTETGFRSEGVLTLRTALPWPAYEKTAHRERFFREVLEGVRALPGVTAAAYVTGLPMAMPGGIWRAEVEGVPADRAHPQMASIRFSTPGLFQALGIPLRRGRDLRDGDRLDQPAVAVVSESFARRHWPGVDPLGRRFRLNAEGFRSVVGVVGDVRVRGLERTSEPQVYYPYNQVEDGNYVAYTPKELVVRASGDAMALVPAIRRIVATADPQQPISNVRPMSEVVAEQTASRAVHVTVLGAFALAAALLAAVGIHGLLSYTVSSRRQEIAVRMALGADARAVVSMVTRQGVRLAAAGVLPGTLLAYAAARSMQALLAGVRPADAATFLLASLLCTAMALLGSLFPALRAARVTPMAAMRAE